MPTIKQKYIKCKIQHKLFLVTTNKRKKNHVYCTQKSICKYLHTFSPFNIHFHTKTVFALQWHNFSKLTLSGWPTQPNQIIWWSISHNRNKNIYIMWALDIFRINIYNIHKTQEKKKSPKQIKCFFIKAYVKQNECLVYKPSLMIVKLLRL